ncbi:EcsC family protein [Rhodoferax aquaticus]|uniref:DUF697 domain-containing protein n=1 Tax=Rhodoferax aquaticus TaxID=2527691 RepID=A0A515EN50_9BURK|nr:EcsC family protein [Rhodoferax aquaticus]QDL54083.1 DUF697 domain-containing protein [Rhodoferax aquaticus]
MTKPESALSALPEAIFSLVLAVPTSHETTADNPQARAHTIARAAARKASMLAGTLSLPPGLLGWATVLPELIGVWKIQAQMVADIAAVYGQPSQNMGREQMLYCLFKHVSAQLFRDVAVRIGERVVIQQMSGKVLQAIAQQLGAKLTQTLVSKGAARFVPMVGALGVGAYAYFDTIQVAKNAESLFAERITVND